LRGREGGREKEEREGEGRVEERNLDGQIQGWLHDITFPHSIIKMIPAPLLPLNKSRVGSWCFASSCPEGVGVVLVSPDTRYRGHGTVHTLSSPPRHA
jgi:hypothetical protein